jgi:hypothetical protein
LKARIEQWTNQNTPIKKSKIRVKKVGSSYEKFGRGGAIICEQPDAIRTYLMRWYGVKLDLTKLAKLRWIEEMKTPDLCAVFGKRRTAIRQSLRTLRKCGISELNLTPEEKYKP